MVALVAAMAPILLAGHAGAATGFTSSLVNQGNGTCVTVPGSSTSAGVQLTQAACQGAANQSFTFTAVSGTTDIYTIGTVTAGSCVDVYGASTADNAQIIQWPCHSNTNQQFRLQPVTISGAANTFAVTAVSSGKCVVPAADATTSGTGLVQLPCTGATSRVWRLPAYPTTTPSSPVATTPATGSGTFTNPIKARGPDPWLQYYNGYYYLATTTWNNTVTMRRATTLGGLASASDTVLFTLTRANGAGTMWAPEFHLLTGPNGTGGTCTTSPARNPTTWAPSASTSWRAPGPTRWVPYTFKADLLDPTSDNTWELDPSILQLNGKLYLLGTYYNGSQPIFIRRLSNPWTAGRHPTPAVHADLQLGDRRRSRQRGRRGAAAQRKDLHRLLRQPLLHPRLQARDAHLQRRGPAQLPPRGSSPPNPVFQRSDANGVYGPGHNGFFKSPDGTEDWIVYHANSSASGGCDMNRSTRAQKFTWNADGTPNFGTPVATGVRLTAPSGEPTS